MAKTLTVADVVNMLGLKYPRLLTEGFAARLADEAIGMIWNRYPWRPSLVELPPFFLVREVADYGPPTYAVPADFKGLHAAWLRQWDGYKYEPELLVKPSVSISIAPGMPTAIAYHPERSAFRLHPRPSMGGPEIWVEGIYKKLHTKVTNANMNSYVLPWEDEYFGVVRAVLEAKYKSAILGSQDAPQALMLARRFVDDMAAAEGLHSGVVTIAPAASLELGG